jgi:hypothetical protein
MMDTEKKDDAAKKEKDTAQPQTTAEEKYEPPQLVKFERLEKLIVSGE